MAHLASSVGARRGRWTPQQINDAVGLLLEERRLSEDFEAEWRERRRAFKRDGQRNVTPPESAELAAMPWLTWPRAKIQNRRLVSREVPPADAFPFRPVQRRDYDAVCRRIPKAAHELAQGFVVRVYDDWLRIPVRIYNAPPDAAALSQLSDSQRLMVHCLYTRHHDGRVRQHHLSPILAADEPWVAPYVVALIGEYVVEIVIDIAAGLDTVTTDGSWQQRRYGRFVADNSEFMKLTRQRVWSYWRAYYTGEYASSPGDPSGRPVYPAFELVRVLEDAGRARA
jgi:hypothetical protein